MSLEIIPTKVPFSDESSTIELDAFCFIPELGKEVKTVSIFTHGFTSHKGSLLNWSLRLAEEGVAGILFDLPGHYLGCFTELKSFESFTRNCTQLFPNAFKALKHKVPSIDETETKLILGGHSLGALLSLKAIEDPSFKSFHSLQAICVGLGFPPKGVTHIFDTPFYKSTLLIRGQLVSPSIHPDKMFPWIKEEKENLKVSNQNIFLLTGEDDFVVGKDGAERLKEKLEDLGNHVDLEKPAKLAHHLPENAAPHIKKWLKDKGLFN